MLQVGDKVKMNGKYYVNKEDREKVFQVIAGPQEVCGSTCVWLEGFVCGAGIWRSGRIGAGDQ